MELEKLNSNKFEKFKPNEIKELTSSIKGGDISTNDKIGNNDCWHVDTTGISVSDLVTGACGGNQDAYTLANMPFSPGQNLVISANSVVKPYNMPTNNKKNRF